MKRIAFALVALLFAASGVMAQSATDAAATETASTSTKTAVYTLQKTGDGYQLEGQDQAPATQKEGLYQAVEQANGNAAAKPACSGKKQASASGCCAKKSAASASAAGCSKEAAAAKAHCGAEAKASAGKACCSKDHAKKPQ